MCRAFELIKNSSRLAGIFVRNSSSMKVMHPQVMKELFNLTLKSSETYNMKVCNVCVLPCRTFAKSKDKVKSGGTRVQINDNELQVIFDTEKLYSDFKRPVSTFKMQLIEKTSLKTNMNAINELKVRYDNNTYMLQDLAEIGRRSGKEVILEMGAFPGAIPAVMEALRNSAMNLNPSQDGNTIIVPISKVTREHRQNLAKGAKALFNTCKDMIRNVQNRSLKKIDDAEKLPKDDAFNLKAQITSIAEKHMSEAEALLKAKEEELLSGQ